ncbi:glycosyltransferase [Psychrobacter celer]
MKNMNYIPKSIYFVTNNMPRKHGGRTKSMLQRAKLLTSTFSNHIYILTTRYNNDYWIIWEDFYKRDLIDDKKVFYINLYHDLMLNRYYRGDNNVIEKLIDLDVFNDNYFNAVLDIVQRAFNKNQKSIPEKLIAEGYSVNFEYRTSLLNSKEQRLYSIKVIDNINLSKNIEFFVDRNNNVLRICHYNKSGSIISERFVDRDGVEYLNKRYKYESGKRKLIDMRYQNGSYSRKGVIIFKSYRQLYAFWFENVMSHHSFVVCDVRNYDYALTDTRAKSKDMYFTCLFHSNHKSSKAYNYIIENHEYVDKIITLTNEQYEDLLPKLPSSKMSVIPHSTHIPKLSNDTKRQNFVVISRLAKSKQIDHVIKAFSEVVKNYPNFILDIYGEGDQEEFLKQVASDLKLHNNVIFHGSTNSPLEIFQKAKCSIVTSDFEGFTLTIQESLANGCPVVSYRLKYGPLDMIQNGTNGYLVEKDDIEGLAARLNLIASDDVIFDEDIIQESMKNFTHDKFIDNWSNLFKESVSF